MYTMTDDDDYNNNDDNDEGDDDDDDDMYCTFWFTFSYTITNVCLSSHLRSFTLIVCLYNLRG